MIVTRCFCSIKFYALIACCITLFSLQGQVGKTLSQDTVRIEKRRFIAPIWTYQDMNRDIYGLALGFSSRNKLFNTRTNGVRIEAVGMGLFLAMLPSFPEREEDEFREIMEAAPFQVINGVNLSPLGSLCGCDVNGISLGGWGQWMRSVNGISASIAMNIVERNNGVSLGAWNISTQTSGIQLGLIYNQAMVVHGIQIGSFNVAKKLKGFQFGLWNVNQKRKLPLVNWAF